MKIDHIAIAVNDVEESAKVYQEALGIDVVEFETIESEGVKVAILHLENGRIELMHSWAGGTWFYSVLSQPASC